MQIFYALKAKNKFELICVSVNPKRFQEKVNQMYWRKSGMQPRGTTYTIDDFLSQYDKVRVMIESYEEQLT